MKSKKSIIMHIITVVLFLFTISFFLYAFYQRNIVADKYEKAQEMLDKGNYEEAVKIFSTLKDYKDSNNLKKEAEQGLLYLEATDLMSSNDYVGAISKYAEIEGYKDSNDKITEIKYKLAVDYYEKQEYDSAKKIFIELDDYLESKFYLAQIDIKNIELSKKVIYEKATLQFEEQSYGEAMELFESILDYSNAKEMVEECKLQMIRRNMNNIVAGGIRCSVAITDKGTVLAIGANPEGQCNVDNWENIVSVDTYGCFTIGLDTNGNVKLAGRYDGKKVDITNWNEIVDIAAGERFVVGLKKDGTVVADGHNGEHQIDIETWKNVIAIDAGWNFTVALTKDNKLLYAGVDNGQEEQFYQNEDEWKDVVNISASGGGNTNKRRGKGHTVGLRSDGTVVAIGDNTYGQCEVSNWKDIVKVATGDWYTVGLQKNGEIVITGSNTPGNRYIESNIIEGCTNIVDIAAGFGHTLCLNEDGTVIAFGFNEDDKCSGTTKWKHLMIP